MFVLLTGATGFVGAATLRKLIKAGHRVRATARDVAKADYIKQQYPDAPLEFVIIKDQLAHNAYVDSAKDVDAIVHVSSPFHANATDAKRDMIEPAVGMTSAIMNAANLSPTVKRVEIVSSFAAVLTPGKINNGEHYSAADWCPLTEEDAVKNAGIAAYIYSKKAAEKYAWDFIEQSHPQFDLVVINPPYIFGHAQQQVTSLDSLNTSLAALRGLLDAKEIPPDLTPDFVDVDDCAEALTRALVTPAASNKRYLLCGGGFTMYDIVESFKRLYPEQAHRMPSGKPSGTIPAVLDTTPAQKDLGMKFQTLDETIKHSFDSIFRLEKELA